MFLDFSILLSYNGNIIQTLMWTNFCRHAREEVRNKINYIVKWTDNTLNNQVVWTFSFSVIKMRCTCDKFLSTLKSLTNPLLSPTSIYRAISLGRNYFFWYSLFLESYNIADSTHTTFENKCCIRRVDNKTDWLKRYHICTELLLLLIDLFIAADEYNIAYTGLR